MINQVQAKGATPMVSSQTPDNPYDNSATIVKTPPRVNNLLCPALYLCSLATSHPQFVQYARDAAAAADVAYVDHFAVRLSTFTVTPEHSSMS